jgi:hypothetical protein
VSSAKIQAIVTDAELLQLIIGKKLKTLTASHGNAKLASLLVLPTEIIEITGKVSRGLTGVQIAQRLKIRAGLWSELCKSGYLAKPHIRTSRGVKLTAMSDVEEFERCYISLGHVAHKLGVRTQAAKALLKRASVQFLELPSQRQSIFKRADVEAAFPQLR